MSKYLIENLFGIEGWSIAWYGVIIAVGMVLGVTAKHIHIRKKSICRRELRYIFTKTENVKKYCTGHL